MYKVQILPKSHELDEDKELAAKGIRKCYYRKYKIYFYIDESSKRVYYIC